MHYICNNFQLLSIFLISLAFFHSFDPSIYFFSHQTTFPQHRNIIPRGGGSQVSMSKAIITFIDSMVAMAASKRKLDLINSVNLNAEGIEGSRFKIGYKKKSSPHWNIVKIFNNHAVHLNIMSTNTFLFTKCNRSVG